MQKGMCNMLKAGVAKCQECQKSKNTTNISYLLYTKSYNISIKYLLRYVYVSMLLCWLLYSYVFANNNTVIP